MLGLSWIVLAIASFITWYNTLHAWHQGRDHSAIGWLMLALLVSHLFSWISINLGTKARASRWR